MAKFDAIKKAAAELEATSDQTKIDRVEELHYALEKGKEDALTDIRGDIKKTYPKNEDKQNEELKAVEAILRKLENQYKNKSTGNLEDFTKETNSYFNELRQLVGEDVELSGRVIDTADPETFWRNATGWYEKVPAKVKGKDKKQSFEEEVVEGLATSWKEEIHTFQGENNRIKEEDGGIEKFQNWLQEHRAELREIILRPIGDRKYVVDFSNISKNIDATLKESSKEADFIARNIGLADLLADKAQAVTVFGENGAVTGCLDNEFRRSNKLKGGYLTKEGKYLTIWHGAIVSTKPDDSVDDELEEESFEKRDTAKEEREKEELRTLTIVNISDSGSVIAETRMQYNPVEIPDTLSETEKAERAKRIQQTVESRRRTLENTPAGTDPKGEYTVKCVYMAPQQGAENTLMPQERELTFKATPNSSSLNYKYPTQEYSYTATQSQYSNIEVAVPLNNDRMFLVKAKRQTSRKSQKTLVIYETDSVAKLNERLEEEVQEQDYSTSSSQGIPDGEVEVIEFETSASVETIDRYLRQIKDKYKKVKRIIIRGDSYSKTIELMATGSAETLKFQNSDVTEKGLDPLKPKEETTTLKLEDNGNVSKKALAKLRKSLPNLKTVRVEGAKTLEKDALLEVASMPSLAEASLSFSAFNPEDIAYFGRSTSLRKLYLDNTAVTDYALGLMIVNGDKTNLINLTHLSLARTPITDEGLKYVGRLENLEELDLSNNKNITYKGIGYLKGIPPSKGLEKLKVLNLSGTSVDAAALMYISQFQSLENLDLSNTNIDAKALEAIADNLGALHNLKTLNLQGTKFTKEEFGKLLTELVNTYLTLLAPTLTPEESGLSPEEQLLNLIEKGTLSIPEITGPDGKKYTKNDIINLFIKSLSPQEPEETQENKDQKSCNKRIAYIQTLFDENAPGLSISFQKLDPQKRKYYADITKIGVDKEEETGFRIIGHLDSKIFKIVSPENRYIDIETYNGNNWKEKAKNAIEDVNAQIEAAEAAKAAAETTETPVVPNENSEGN